MNYKNSQLKNLLADCKKGKTNRQKELYQMHYGYGLTVCMHYSKNREEAEEILNDGFLKMFNNIDTFQFRSTFRVWLRKILVRSAIDYYRKFHAKKDRLDIIHLQKPPEIFNEAVYQLSLDDTLNLLQQIPPSYRIVFNLFVLEGHTHKEISELLEIGIGTSKSNLAKAKKKLRELAIPFFQTDQKIFKS
ncbi:MAG TPA: RNA polymerase sigma factor [Bacteroidetes bacterium]|nr:RNA polymerase sigma factor [Bacteroidota bacterium]